MRIESIGGGWVGREHGGLKPTFKHKYQCSSVVDPDWHNSLGRPGLPSESVLHAVLLMPLRGHICHEMHLHGFAVLENRRLQKQTWPSRLKCLLSLDGARV